MKRGFLFNSIPAPRLRRTAFNLSRENTVALQMGKLVPIMCQECLPGDTFKISPKQLTRLMALNSPMMQRVDVKLEFFKVPNRLLMKDWEDFITGGESGTETPSKPTAKLSEIMDMDSQLLETGSLADYLGIPLPYSRNLSTGAWSQIPLANWGNDGPTIDLMPFNAYTKVWNDYYRDQNLQTEIPLCDESKEYDQSDEEFASGLFYLKNRAWKKDYFTSALTDPQRGNAVGIGLAGEADVDGVASINDREIKVGYSHNQQPIYPSGTGFAETNPDGYMTVHDSGEPEGNAYVTLGDVPVTGSADMSTASAIGITALRTAFKIQQFLERNNVAGARYIENILAHFGVKSSDARLQRAEFLRGYSAPVMISEVESNADSDGVPVGELAGKGKSAAAWDKPFKTFCEEHCFIVGIMSVIPTAKYGQGLSRMWTRFDKYDYFWNEFEHIGEQDIKNKEIYYDFLTGSSTIADQTFGYTARYAEYKYAPDEIHGDLKTSLSFWHQGRLFDNLPALNEDFIKCAPSDRVFAVQDAVSDQKVVADLWLDVKAVRPMSKYGTPRLT